MNGKGNNCSSFTHTVSPTVHLLVNLGKDSEFPVRLHPMDTVNVTKTCNISFSYQTKLDFPKYGIINLTTKADKIVVGNMR